MMVLFCVVVVVMNSVGNLLIMFGISVLGIFVLCSGVWCMIRLVIVFLLCLVWFFLMIFVFIRCSVVSRLVWCGFRLMVCRCSMELGMMLVVIRKKVVEEKLVGIVILVVCRCWLLCRWVWFGEKVMFMLNVCSMCLV